MFFKVVGLMFIVLGFVFTLYTGLDFGGKEKVLDVGSVQVSDDKKDTTSFSPLLGIGAIIIGGIIFISANKLKFRNNNDRRR